LLRGGGVGKLPTVGDLGAKPQFSGPDLHYAGPLALFAFCRDGTC